MNHDDYALALGQLWGNINSLEVMLRIVLQKREKLDHKYDLCALKAGDTVPADFVTKAAYFSTLVSGFNDIAKPEHKIPWELVTLRNALAHGSMLSKTMSFPLKLVKFGKEDKAKPGVVPVEMAEELTLDWLVTQRKRFAAVFEKVSSYGQ